MLNLLGMKCLAGKTSKRSLTPSQALFSITVIEVSSHLCAMIELRGELLFEMIHGFISKEEDENTP